MLELCRATWLGSSLVTLALQRDDGSPQVYHPDPNVIIEVNSKLLWISNITNALKSATITIFMFIVRPVGQNKHRWLKPWNPSHTQDLVPAQPTGSMGVEEVSVLVLIEFHFKSILYIIDAEPFFAMIPGGNLSDPFHPFCSWHPTSWQGFPHGDT